MWGEFITSLILLPVVVLLMWATIKCSRLVKDWNDVHIWSFPVIMFGIAAVAAFVGFCICVGIMLVELCKAF